MAKERLLWDQPTPYERWYASSLGRAYANSLGRFLRPWLSPTVGSLVLDIGCGPGLMMERLFSPEARVIGMDCSWEMAARAFQHSRQAGHPRQFVVGSALRIPFSDGSFDLTFCVNCLEFVADRELAFLEIARILRPAGTAILGVLNRASIWEWTRRVRRPFSRKPYYRGRFFTTNEVEHLCAKVGLKVEEIRSVAHFPPIRPGPLRRFYEWLDQGCVEHRAAWGAVLLCRAVKVI
jgi:SAM-dependent methyltransferase